jgi:hypothetical protein
MPILIRRKNVFGQAGLLTVLATVLIGAGTAQPIPKDQLDENKFSRSRVRPGSYTDYRDYLHERGKPALKDCKSATQNRPTATKAGEKVGEPVPNELRQDRFPYSHDCLVRPASYSSYQEFLRERGKPALKYHDSVNRQRSTGTGSEKPGSTSMRDGAASVKNKKASRNLATGLPVSGASKSGSRVDRKNHSTRVDSYSTGYIQGGQHERKGTQ